MQANGKETLHTIRFDFWSRKMNFSSKLLLHKRDCPYCVRNVYEIRTYKNAKVRTPHIFICLPQIEGVVSDCFLPGCNCSSVSV